MLIECESLVELLGSHRVVLFDCRFQLQDPNAGRAAYEASHIPGAVYLDLNQDMSSKPSEHGGRHPLPDTDRLAATFSAAGVSHDVTVVVYDANEGMAARAWWLLQYLGHKDVLVLNGGWSAWNNGEYPVTDLIPTPQAQQFVPDVQHHWVASVGDVELWLEVGGNVRLIDARAPERYRGDIEPLDPAAGHIPDAVNHPWNDNFTETGYWKNAEQLYTALAPLMGEQNEMPSSIMYCGSGVTACNNVLAAVLAGLPRPQLYAGSWSDWCSYPDHPIKTGHQP